MGDAAAQYTESQKTHGNKHLGRSVTAPYFTGAFTILQAFLLAYIINQVIFHHIETAALQKAMAGLVAIFALRFGFSWYADRQAFLAAQDVKRHVRLRLYEKLRERGPLFIGGQGSGALLNTLTDGVEALEKYYSQYLPAKRLMSFLPLAVLIFVLPKDWLSGVVMLLTAPLIPIFMMIIGKGTEKKNKQQWRKLARMGNHFLDAVQGMGTLKIFGAAKRESAAIARISEEYRRETMGVLRIAFLSSTVLEFFAAVSIAVIAVLVGFRLMWGTLDFHTGFFVLLLAPEFYLPLRKLGSAYHARMEAIGAAEKMAEIMDFKAISKEEKKAAKAAKTAKATNASKSVDAIPAQSAPAIPAQDITPAKQPLPPQLFPLALENVAVRYENDRTALHDVSLQIAEGQHIALIGPSGAGKSTIMALLLGFIAPSAGRVTIGKQDLHETDMAAWRAQISWIPQRPTLFHGNILDNIRMGNPAASDEEIKTLCRDIGIDDFIHALPQAYNTPIGDQSHGLSGGEAQRIAIARAFLRDAPLLLMDEPTASLDHGTEQLIQSVINRQQGKKTIISIAHRLHTIRKADQIVFIEAGNITATGTHDALMKTHKSYQELIAQEIAPSDLNAAGRPSDTKAHKTGGKA